MSAHWEASVLEFAWIVGAGVVLFSWLLLIGWLVRIAPVSRARRDRWRRLTSLVAVGVWIAYAGWGLQRLFAGQPEFVPYVLGAALLGLFVALWNPLRDVVAGALVRAGAVCREGDEVHIDEVHGRVERLGYRGLIVGTQDGEAVVPYSMVTRTAVVRAVHAEGAQPHTFVLREPLAMSASELRTAVRETALLTHWASILREPVIRPAGGGTYHVTVFALHADYAPDIEATIRSRLGSLEERARRNARSLQPSSTAADEDHPGGPGRRSGQGRVA